jgi:hypothetical protein
MTRLAKWGPLGALGLCVLGLFSPVVLAGRVFFLKDAQLWFYPSRLALRARLASLDVPEWLPGLDLGTPFLADPGNGTLYPPNVLLLAPAPYCVGLFLVAHVLLAAFGAERLLRSLGTGRAARVFGALGFALGGYLVSMTWSGVYLLSLAWMPLVAWLAVRVLRRRRPADAVWMALALGTQILSGELQGVWLTGWIVAALVIARPGSWKRKQAGVGWLAGALLLALCFAAPQLLPTLDFLPASRRAAGIDVTEASHWSFHPLRALELAVPWLFGNPLNHAGYLGYFMNDEGGSLHRDPWMVSPYAGSLSLAFAALAFVRTRPRHRWWTRALASVGLFGLLLAVGRHTPVFGAYFSLVPGASFFRYPAKFFGLVALCLPLVAAAGVDSWTRSAKSLDVTARVAAGLAGVLLALRLAAPLAAGRLIELCPELPAGTVATTLERAIDIELGIVVLSAVVLFVIVRRTPRFGAAAASALLAIQLGRAQLGAYETAEPEIYARPPLAERIVESAPAGEPPRLLQPLPALDVPGLDAMPGPERAKILSAALMKNTGILFGVGYPDTYSAAGSPRHRAVFAALDDVQRAALDLFSVRFVVLPKTESVPRGSGLEQLDGVGEIGGVAYRDAAALPLARPVSEVVAVGSPDAALRSLRSPEVLSGRAIVLEGEAGALPPASRSLGQCRPSRLDGDTVDVACRLEHDAWVVVNVSHHPSWSATVDGEPTDIVRANAIVMALRVPAGSHELRFLYSEPSLPLGAAVAAFALLGALALARWRNGQ